MSNVVITNSYGAVTSAPAGRPACVQLRNQLEGAKVLSALAATLLPFAFLVGGFILLYGIFTGDYDPGVSRRTYDNFEAGQQAYEQGKYDESAKAYDEAASRGAEPGTFEPGTATPLVPSVAYWTRHGRNPALAYKTTAEADFYGLKIRQLLIPIDEHPIGAFRAMAAKVNRASFPIEAEGTTARIGFVGSAGVLRSAAPEACTACM